MNSIVEIKKLTKYYGKLHVLDRLNFDIKEGEFISIVGPSGCGKTTLLKIIGGLIQPTEGKITVKNNPVEEALKRRSFGFIFQNPILLPWRNALENINLSLEILNQRRSLELPRELLKLVGLSGFENFYPRELSGGMQQRVAIARALVFKPSILLMDEPFGSLDEITRNLMNLELLRILRERETTSTVIFVTHSIPEAVFLSDRVVVLSQRPAKIQGIININLPKLRKTEIKYSKDYIQTIECLRKLLKES